MFGVKRRKFSGKREAAIQSLIENSSAFERDNADAPKVGPQPYRTKSYVSLRNVAGNPAFKAQFNIKLLKYYYTESSGTYTAIASASLATTLKNSLPAFVFGQTDAQSGFPKLRAQYPVTTWAYDNAFVYGIGAPGWGHFSVLSSTVTANLQQGDMVLVFWATTAGPVNTVATVVIRSTNVAYATLLNALSSDTFETSLLRYTLATADVAQYGNGIGVYDQSLFGKFNSDNIDPTAFVQPDQQQAGVTDIPILDTINKNKAWATYINYDVNTVTWSVFVSSTDKLL